MITQINNLLDKKIKNFLSKLIAITLISSLFIHIFKININFEFIQELKYIKVINDNFYIISKINDFILIIITLFLISLSIKSLLKLLKLDKIYTPTSIKDLTIDLINLEMYILAFNHILFKTNIMNNHIVIEIIYNYNILNFYKETFIYIGLIISLIFTIIYTLALFLD